MPNNKSSTVPGCVDFAEVDQSSRVCPFAAVNPVTDKIGSCALRSLWIRQGGKIVVCHLFSLLCRGKMWQTLHK